MYMLNMVIILIVMYCNVVTAIDKIPMYLLRFNMRWTLCWIFARGMILHILPPSLSVTLGPGVHLDVRFL